MTPPPRTPSPALPRRLWLAHAAGLAAAMHLAGCATPPEAAKTGWPADPTPAAWSTDVPAGAGPAAPAAIDWWRHFNDPQLSALVAQAAQANTEIRTAQAALRQAQALRDVRAAALGPDITVSGSAQRAKSAGGDAANSFAVSLGASWTPDIFGGNQAALDATVADARAAWASLAGTRVNIAAEVALAYLDLRGQQQRLAIARSSLAAQTETLQLTRWRVQAGLASSLDLEQAVAASEQTAAQIPSLETSIAQALSRLAVLTAQAPGMLRTTLDAPQKVPQPDARLAVSLPAETLRQRPDVRAAEQRVNAALARVAQADAARYPSFQLSGSLGLRALTLGALTHGASVANSLLASVSAPLFDGGAARAQVHVQEAALEQARLAWQATVLGALKDVEDALTALRGDRERLGRLQAAADAAANADLLARQRYKSGLIDFRTVLDTQRTLLSTQDSVESTRAALAADHVRLYRALGGGWTADTPAPADLAATP